MDLQLKKVRQLPHIHDASIVIREGIVRLYGSDADAVGSIARVLAFVRRPQGGDIRINGQSWTDGYFRRFVGFLPNMQSQWVPEGPRVRQSLDYFAALWMVSLSARERDAMLDRWGLLEVADYPVAELSFGQHKRFALAVSLVMDPLIWIAEEPFPGLDSLGKVVLQDILWQRQLQGTISILAQQSPDDGKLTWTQQLEVRQGALVDIAGPSL